MQETIGWTLMIVSIIAAVIALFGRVSPTAKTVVCVLASAGIIVGFACVSFNNTPHFETPTEANQPPR